MFHIFVQVILILLYILYRYCISFNVYLQQCLQWLLIKVSSLVVWQPILLMSSTGFHYFVLIILFLFTVSSMTVVNVRFVVTTCLLYDYVQQCSVCFYAGQKLFITRTINRFYSSIFFSAVTAQTSQTYSSGFHIFLPVTHFAHLTIRCPHFFFQTHVAGK